MNQPNQQNSDTIYQQLQETCLTYISNITQFISINLKKYGHEHEEKVKESIIMIQKFNENTTKSTLPNASTASTSASIVEDIEVENSENQELVQE